MPQTPHLDPELMVHYLREHGMNEEIRKTEANKELMKMDVIAGHVLGILQEMGLDISEPGLEETPRRVSEYLLEFSNKRDYNKILGAKFESQGHHGMVAQAPIPFRMLCEHHLAPALGKAAIGYIPNEHVVGLSKLTRLIQAVGTERPSLQEYIGDKCANLIEAHLKPKGCIVVIKAEHGCMACRGVNSPGIKTMTSSVRGAFLLNEAARNEFFNLVGAF